MAVFLLFYWIVKYLPSIFFYTIYLIEFVSLLNYIQDVLAIPAVATVAYNERWLF